jgi:hypothetical protein
MPPELQSPTPKTGPLTVQLTLRDVAPAHETAPAARRLARLCKAMLRSYGFKIVMASEINSTQREEGKDVA